MSDTRDIIVRLLDNIGSKKEVEQYLRHYASGDAPKFAVIKVSGSVVDASVESLASSLSFLKAVGMAPIVVHGGGVQIERAVAAAGLSVPLVDGMLPMTPQVLEIARPALLDVGGQIVDALDSLGTRARPFTSGVLQVKAELEGERGLVPVPVKTNHAALVAAARAGAIPVVSPFGETLGGQIAVVHADVVAREIALALRPHKVVFLSNRGGLVERSGAVIPAVNLAEDYERVLAERDLDPASRHELVILTELLAQLPPTSSASVTSPEHLARELFTYRGAGTLVRRGEQIRVHAGFEPIDTPRLRGLLEECFGRRLHVDYFALKEPLRVYLAESYRATAIVTREGAVPYLDKFAVTPEAQGEGIGGSLWRRLRADTPKLFWRSRAQNPVNTWYAQQADGLVKAKDFWIFWCGMDDFDEIRACVERARAMKATLKDGAPDTTSSPPVVAVPGAAS